MKRVITSILSAAICTAAFAQSAEDALNYSQMHYEGTARTIAMGNAFTALGGDLGSIAINPAGSAVFNSSQFGVSGSLTSSSGKSNYLNNSCKESFTEFSVPDFGAIFNLGGNINFGVAVNKVNNLNSTMSARGTTGESSALASTASSLTGINNQDLEKRSDYNPFYNSNISWPAILMWKTYLLAPLDGQDDLYISSVENQYGKVLAIGGDLQQDHYRKSIGNTTSIAMNIGGNVNDMIYWGANLNILSFRYTLTEDYSEFSKDAGDFQDGFVSYRSSYYLKTSGAGVNIQMGVIATPVGGLRLGATFTTPTWYTLNDYWQYDASSSFSNGHSYKEYSPSGNFQYALNTPMRWTIGGAYTFGTIGLVSAEYEGVSCTTMKLSNTTGNSADFSIENAQIRSNYRTATNFRVGGEIWPVGYLAIRAGYSYYGSTGYYAGEEHTDANLHPATHYYSGGIGLRFGRLTLDLAYQRRANQGENFRLYDGYDGILAPEGYVKFAQNKFVLSFAVNF